MLVNVFIINYIDCEFYHGVHKGSTEFHGEVTTCKKIFEA